MWLMLERLELRNALKFGGISRKEFRVYMEKQVDLWAKATAMSLAMAMMLAFVVALTDEPHEQHDQALLLMVVEIFGTYIGGTYLGRMVC